MPEPLILKVQADTQGVPEGFNRVQKSVDGLDLSSRKASNAMKGFVQDLSQAKDASDVASAALGAFSKILGTSLAATGIVIAGKAIIDAFSNVSKIVEDTKDRVAKASAEIKKAGLDIGFSQAAAEAKKLSDEADGARASIEKLDKSFLMGLVATITGAREELGKLAGDAEKLAQQRLFEGARAERIRTEERAGLGGGALQIRDVEERIKRELAPINILTTEGAAAAAEILKRGELDIQAIRQKGRDELDRKEAETRVKEIEADIKGAEEANKIARKYDEEILKQEERIEKMRQEAAKEDEKKRKDQERLIEKSADLQEKQLNAQDRVNAAREALIRAEGEVANVLVRATGTGRGAQARASSLEIGAQKAAQRAFDQERRRQTQAQREEIRKRLGPGADASDINREIQRRMEEQARQRAREPFTAQKEAAQNLKSSEAYLDQINQLLSSTLDELKSYAHAGAGT